MKTKFQRKNYWLGWAGLHVDVGWIYRREGEVGDVVGNWRWMVINPETFLWRGGWKRGIEGMGWLLLPRKVGVYRSHEQNGPSCHKISCACTLF